MSTFLSTLQEVKGEPIRKKKVARKATAPKSAKASSTMTGAASQCPTTAATRAPKREPATGDTTLPSSQHGPSKSPDPVQDTCPGVTRQAVSQTVTPVVERTPIPKRHTSTGPSLTSSSRSKPASPSADDDRSASSPTVADRSSGHEVSLDDASQSTGNIVVRDIAPATHPPPPAPVRKSFKVGDPELSRRLEKLKSRQCDNDQEPNNGQPVWGLEGSVPSPVYEHPPLDQGPSIASPAGSDSSYHPKSPGVSCIPQTEKSHIPQVVDPVRHTTYEPPTANNANPSLKNQHDLVAQAATKDVAQLQRPPARDHRVPVSSEVKQGPRRLKRSQYAAMKQHEILKEARVRKLELCNEGKEHLMEMLILNDKSYFELMHMLGDRYEATDFARRCIKHEVYNKRAKEVRAKAAWMVFQRKLAHKKTPGVKKEQQCIEEPKEAEETKKEVREEFKAELNEMKSEGHEEKLKSEPAVKEQEQEDDRMRKRKDSHGSETSHMSKPITPRLSGDDTGKEQPKGKKRARRENEEAENPTKKRPKTTSLDGEDAKKPRKKAKATSPSRALPGAKSQRKTVALPRAMQASANKEPSTKSIDVEMSDADESANAQPPKTAIKKGARKKKPGKKPPQAPKHRTRSASTVEESEDEKMEDADQVFEEELDDNDFIVEDIDYRPKRSKVGAMARTKLFAGMR